jgi:tetratricopeptide (TPR) repeat protein
VMAFEGSGDFEAALGHAKKVVEIAGRFGDRDLLAMGLHDQGRALVALRRIEEGNTLMDEAMVAAVSGELSPMITGIIYCNMVTMCEEVGDYSRAGEWTEAAKRWCERQAIAGFPGLCRVHRAGIIRIRGEWSQAESETLMAFEELRDFNHGYAAEAAYQLGEIKLETGDLEGADEAFERARQLGREPQPGLGRLLHARGQTGAAMSCLHRALEEETRELHRARLLPALVEVAVALGDVERASTAAEELESAAAVYATPALEATALAARGMTLLANEDLSSAIEKLRGAIRMWNEVGAPYLAARAREVLAEAYSLEGDEEAARRERDAARSGLQQLSDSARPLQASDVTGVEPRILFRREGDYWTLGREQDVFRLKHSKGLQHLQRLISFPGQEFHALDLAREFSARSDRETVESDEVALDVQDAGAVLDPTAKTAYRRRIADLEEEILEAESWSDPDRAERARTELEFIAHQLAGAVGLGGRDRRAASASERARVNITRAIKTTIDRISVNDPSLGRHLAASVKTGTFCAYRPEPDTSIVWTF